MSELEPVRSPAKRIVLTLVAVIAIVMLIGFISGWLRISVNSEKDEDTNTVDLRLTLDKEELQKDTTEAKREVQSAAEAAKSVASLSTIEGRIITLDSKTPLLTVAPTTDDEDQPVEQDPEEFVTIRLNEATEITVGDEEQATVTSLRQDDIVTVVYSVKNEVNWAESISVLEKTKKEKQAESTP